MRHDLHQRDQGDGQPRDLPVSRRAVSVLVLLASTLATGCGGSPDSPSAAARTTAAQPQDDRLVLVSGRDDHGMVELRRVPTYDAPEGEHVVGVIRDGTLARVVDVDGQWLRVETVEGASITGWIDDFRLRGEARLVGPPPSCSVRVGRTRRDGGTLVVVRELRAGRILVETVTPPVVRAWASRADLQELPPQGKRCGAIPPDDRHAR